MTRNRGKIEGERLCVFARPPVRGQVKTRLAATLGEGGALACYLAFLEDTLRAARGSRAEVHLHLSEALPPRGRESPELRDARRALQALAGDLRWRIQAPGDLGARMAAAFEMEAREGARRVAIVGSDLPLLSAEALDACLEGLAADAPGRALLAPTDDGGFWCVAGPVGLPWTEIFAGVAWSSGREFEQTRKSLEQAGYPVRVGPTGLDVDDARDLARVEESLRGLRDSIGVCTRLMIARGRQRR